MPGQPTCAPSDILLLLYRRPNTRPDMYPPAQVAWRCGGWCRRRRSGRGPGTSARSPRLPRRQHPIGGCPAPGPRSSRSACLPQTGRCLHGAWLCRPTSGAAEPLRRRAILFQRANPRQREAAPTAVPQTHADFRSFGGARLVSKRPRRVRHARHWMRAAQVPWPSTANPGRQFFTNAASVAWLDRRAQYSNAYYMIYKVVWAWRARMGLILLGPDAAHCVERNLVTVPLTCTGAEGEAIILAQRKKKSAPLGFPQSPKN